MFDNAHLKKFIADHANADGAALALKYSGKVDFDLRFAIEQIEGRKKVRTKLPLFYSTTNLCFPPSISLEQCSSEVTALYKQSICSGKHLIDLSGGFGVDSFFLSQVFKQVDYCESDEILAKIADYNFDLLGAENINTKVGDGTEILQESAEQYDWLYVDPSRRHDAKGKVFLIEDCEPNVIEHLSLFLEKAKRVLIKFSPLLDLNYIIETLSGVNKIHVVSVKNECKELLVELGTEASEEVRIKCVNLLADNRTERFEENWSERKQHIDSSEPLTYIYEANRSIMKAGLQDKLAQGLDFKKLAPYSHFLSSDHLMEWFPGRVFKFLKLLPANAAAIAEALEGGKANVIARNYPLNAAEIYKKYKIVSGGDRFILASTLEDKSKVLMLCERLN